MNDDMMIGAFSHSTAVGKLRQELPDVPTGARINYPRYSLEEAGTVCHYYLRCAYAELFLLFRWFFHFYKHLYSQIILVVSVAMHALVEYS